MNNNILKPYAPFSKKQIAYLERAKHSWFNIADGSKRAGKNIMNIMSFCLELDKHPNDLHLIAGYTSSAAGALIYKSDGFGIERFFWDRCRPGKYEEKPCYYVQTSTGQKILLRAGGKDILSQDIIAGYTFGMAYVTEANRCHPDFIKEVFARTFSSKNRKVYHDINPKSNNHWYYENVLDIPENSNKNYGHFTMADNLSMTNEQIIEVIKSVPKGTLWYERDVLGHRCDPEGRVYPHFRRTNPDGTPCHVIPTIDRSYSKMQVSIDYGSRNEFAMLLWGLHDQTWIAIKEYSYKGSSSDRRTVTEYAKDLDKFVEGLRIEAVTVDPSATPFVDTIYNKYNTWLADNSVSAGIENFATALHLGIIKINDCCKNFISELEGYRYDEKKQGEDAVIKDKDHFPDSARYFVHTNEKANGLISRYIQRKR